MTKTSLFGDLSNLNIFWAFALLVSGLYINLGMLPLIGDESIRGVVAMEMILSGDYVTPTLNGELYLNKPPLFNWILAGLFNITNLNNELIIRLPTTIFLIIYGLTIYLWVSRYLGRNIGLLSALFFVSCGRILFWDSFLGLIDITYSWILFLNFMIIWHFYNKRSFFLLFIVSYCLCAVTFLLKGLPSLVFQGITVGALFIYKKNFKELFSWRHYTGLLIFIIITGSYYLIYHFRNPGHISDIFLRLFTESTQKSALGSNIEKTVFHVLAFPFEVLYHFVPWTMLILFVFNRKISKKVWSNDFIGYCTLIFLSNIIIYWLSPITYPRYLLMLIPLLFIVLIYAGSFHEFEKTINYRIVCIILTIMMAALAIASIALPVIFSTILPVKHYFLKVIFLFVILIIISYAFFTNQRKDRLLYYFVLIVLVSRISFDLFLVPFRQSESWANLCRSDAIQVGKGTKGNQLFVMADTITVPNVYYIMRERDEILTFKEKPDTSSYFIVEDTIHSGYRLKPEYSMRIPYYKKTYYTGKFVKL